MMEGEGDRRRRVRFRQQDAGNDTKLSHGEAQLRKGNDPSERFHRGGRGEPLSSSSHASVSAANTLSLYLRDALRDNHSQSAATALSKKQQPMVAPARVGGGETLMAMRSSDRNDRRNFNQVQENQATHPDSPLSQFLKKRVQARAEADRVVLPSQDPSRTSLATCKTSRFHDASQWARSKRNKPMVNVPISVERLLRDKIHDAKHLREHRLASRPSLDDRDNQSHNSSLVSHADDASRVESTAVIWSRAPVPHKRPHKPDLFRLMAASQPTASVRSPRQSNQTKRYLSAPPIVLDVTRAARRIQHAWKKWHRLSQQAATSTQQQQPAEAVAVDETAADKLEGSLTASLEKPPICDTTAQCAVTTTTTAVAVTERTEELEVAWQTEKDERPVDEDTSVILDHDHHAYDHTTKKPEMWLDDEWSFLEEGRCMTHELLDSHAYGALIEAPTVWTKPHLILERQEIQRLQQERARRSRRRSAGIDRDQVRASGETPVDALLLIQGPNLKQNPKVKEGTSSIRVKLGPHRVRRRHLNRRNPRQPVKSKTQQLGIRTETTGSHHKESLTELDVTTHEEKETTLHTADHHKPELSRQYVVFSNALGAAIDQENEQRNDLISVLHHQEQEAALAAVPHSTSDVGSSESPCENGDNDRSLMRTQAGCASTLCDQDQDQDDSEDDGSTATLQPTSSIAPTCELPELCAESTGREQSAMDPNLDSEIAGRSTTDIPSPIIAAFPPEPEVLVYPSLRQVESEVRQTLDRIHHQSTQDQLNLIDAFADAAYLTTFPPAMEHKNTDYDLHSSSSHSSSSYSDRGSSGPSTNSPTVLDTRKQQEFLKALDEFKQSLQASMASVPGHANRQDLVDTDGVISDTNEPNQSVLADPYLDTAAISVPMADFGDEEEDDDDGYAFNDDTDTDLEAMLHEIQRCKEQFAQARRHSNGVTGVAAGGVGASVQYRQ